MRILPVSFLLASLLTACGGSTVTAQQCSDPMNCNRQTSLCHNSCSSLTCNDCCNEMRRKCIDCAPQEEIKFDGCN
jgi:hypothetical protein